RSQRRKPQQPLSRLSNLTTVAALLLLHELFDAEDVPSCAVALLPAQGVQAFLRLLEVCETAGTTTSL
ncbi:MAG TPA: hypothetical protein VHN81_10915, partial [Edaphobacter sp.]|nr:hypothetical protein [Edaphobacter sp.]